MSLIKILDSDFKLQAILRDVLGCTKYEELNGENTISFSCVLDEKAQYINDNAIVELDDDYFDIVYYQKKQNEDGTMTVDVEAEHISYRLNNPEYNKNYFTSTGTPINVLTEILEDTGFTIGTVEFIESVTYSAQEAKSRRQILMEFLTLLGGEAVFDKFTINILQHRGQIEPQIYTTGKNVKVVSKIFDKREKDEEGNPLISYVCEPLNLPNRSAGLGDEILLIHNEIGVKEQLRVVSVAINPYDPLTCELQIANFVHGLEDQLYRIQTDTVAKGKVYNGCRISADEGFVANRSDNKAKTVLNATEGISIYSDLGSGLVKNFFVDTNGRIKAKGIDIDGSGTFSGTISANQIYGGTLSGVTLNLTTNAVIGDNLRLGSPSNNIEFDKASDGRLYLKRSGAYIQAYHANGVWTNGHICIPTGQSIGQYNSGITSSSYSEVLQFNLNNIKVAPGGNVMSLDMNNNDIFNVGDIVANTVNLQGGTYQRIYRSGVNYIELNSTNIEMFKPVDMNGNNIVGAVGITAQTGNNLTLTGVNNFGIIINSQSYGTRIDGKIGFFGATPTTKTSVTDPSSITTGSAPSAWSQSWGNNVKTDLDNLRSKLAGLIDALQSYGLV